MHFNKQPEKGWNVYHKNKLIALICDSGLIYDFQKGVVKSHISLFNRL